MRIGLCNKSMWTTSSHTLVVITGKDKWDQYRHKQINQLLDGDEPPLREESSYLEESCDGGDAIILMRVKPV